MTMTIRDSLPADIPAITIIYDHAVVHGTASFEIDPPDERDMATRRAALVEAGLPYLVAETDGVVLGYAYAGPYRPRAAYRFTVEDSIYIHPAAKGAGIGKALLAELLLRCETLGYRQMVAVIGDSRSLASIALHRSLGFRPAGTVTAVGFKQGRWLDQVLMQRTLGEGSTSLPL